MLEGAPRPVRWFLRVGSMVGLGLRLGPDQSQEHVLGWPIVTRRPDLVVIEQHSSLVAARQVFWLNSDQLIQSTLYEYQRHLASWVWPPVSVIHRRLIPYLIGRAARTKALPDVEK